MQLSKYKSIYLNKVAFLGQSCVLTKGPTSRPKLGWWNGSSPLSTELLADPIVHVHGSSGDWCMQQESLSPHPLFESQGVVVTTGMRVMVQPMKVPMMMMMMEVRSQLLNLKMWMVKVVLTILMQSQRALNPIIMMMVQWNPKWSPPMPKPKPVLQIQAVWRIMPQVLAACVAPGLFWLVPGKERKHRHLHLQHHPVETQIGLFIFRGDSFSIRFWMVQVDLIFVWISWVFIKPWNFPCKDMALSTPHLQLLPKVPLLFLLESCLGIKFVFYK